MPDFNWDKWNLGWAVGLPKNEMWAKVRTGQTDDRGEPTFQYESKPDTSSADPKIADVLAAHRFANPAVTDTPMDEHCFCGWSGDVHADHLAEAVEAFVAPAPAAAEEEKPAPKKAAAKKSDEKADE